MNWKHRADNCISQGALTNSKHPDMLISGVYPSHIKHGHDVYLYDEKDAKYLDYICGLGTNFLGYGNDHINRHIMKYMYGGFSHSLPTTTEVETAEKLKEIFVFVDRWKFLKSGSEACSAALKYARAATGRTKVVSHGYHGYHDQFVSLTLPHKGVPDDPNIIQYISLDSIDSNTAAVIIEPVITRTDKDWIQWLKDLRKKCDDTGALLIFDEVITSFRFDKYSVSNSFGIIPDMIVIGKAMANGLPLAAVGAKADIMDDKQVFVSTTFAGEVLSLASCYKVCELVQKNSDYKIHFLWEKGQEFIDKFNAIGGPVTIEGYPTRGVFKGSDVNIANFMAEMAKSKILFCKSWFFTFGHIKEMDSTLQICKGVLNKIKDGFEFKHQMPQSPFSMGVRNGK